MSLPRQFIVLASSGNRGLHSNTALQPPDQQRQAVLARSANARSNSCNWQKHPYTISSLERYKRGNSCWPKALEHIAMPTLPGRRTLSLLSSTAWRKTVSVRRTKLVCLRCMGKVCWKYPTLGSLFSRTADRSYRFCGCREHGRYTPTTVEVQGTGHP